MQKLPKAATFGNRLKIVCCVRAAAGFALLPQAKGIADIRN